MDAVGWKKEDAAGEEWPSLLAAWFTMVSPVSLPSQVGCVKPRFRNLSLGHFRAMFAHPAGRLCLLGRAVLLGSPNQQCRRRLTLSGLWKAKPKNRHNPETL
jgi:hypothetical protein